MALPLPGPRTYSDDELLTATELPCRTCGSPVTITPGTRTGTLRRRIRHMTEHGWSTLVTDDYTLHRLDADLEELATVPATCVGAHRACRILWAQCERCGSTFLARRSTARWCSVRCRVAHHRARAT